jgi:hypothetical protein
MSENSDVVRLVAGPFHETVAALWSGDRISEYLLAPAARRHVWHAWLAAAGAARLADRDAAYRRLAFASGRDLLREAHGVLPPGLVRALGRLGPMAQPAQTYADILKVLGDGDPGAKILRHAASIDAKRASLLAALPKPLRMKAVVDSVHLEDARYLAWLACAAGAEDSVLPAALVARLQGCRRWNIVRTMEEHWASPVFPPPPFGAGSLLRPVTTLADLRVTAKRFDNCLESYAGEAAAGSRYFYVWEGEEPAILSVVRVGAIAWRTDELAGVKNRNVSDATRLAIAEALRDIPALFSDDLRSGANRHAMGLDLE